MRPRIHHALFAAFLGVLALLVVLVVVLVGRGLRSEVTGNLRDELRREIRLAGLLVERADGLPPDSLAGLVTDRIGFRTTIVARDGRVLGDSDVGPAALATVGDHGDRPEVRAALAAAGTGDPEPAFAERRSETVGTRLLYAAVPATLDGRAVVIRLAAPLGQVEAALARSRWAVAWAGALAMPLVLLFAYLLSRRLARPLVDLSERAGRFASGELAHRARRRTRLAELDDLGAAFNRLADELQARLSELGRERDGMEALIDCMAEGVIALDGDGRVTRVNRATRVILEIPDPAPLSPIGSVVRQPELREILERSLAEGSRAREVRLGDRHLIVASRRLDRGGSVTTLLDVTELRRIERVRRDFVADASHELKTPLTSMRGFAEALLEDDPPAETRARFLRTIHDNTLRLQQLVDDLLDLSRLESGGWAARREPVDLAALARRVVAELHPAFEAEGIALRFRDPGDHAQRVARADGQGVERILHNLLDNALRYTPGGGVVEVAVEQSGRRMVVEVADTGIGIPTRALPRIFERFYRADAGRARDDGGTGLGLAIVRHLVRAMGGEVRVESEFGRGSTFRISLPAEDAAEEHGGGSDDREEVG